MAIDTENRRRSTIHILPVPDGAIGQGDRRQVTYIYSGILSASSSGLSMDRLYNVPVDDRVYNVPSAAENIYNVPAEDRIYTVRQ